MSKNQRSSKPWILPAADVVDVGFLEDVQPADITGQAQISARLKAEQKRRGFGDSYQANECGYNRSTLQDFLSGRRVWEDDECAFLKRYITYSESKKSEAALKAAYEKANKGQKPDWRTSTPDVKLGVLGPALEQKKTDGVDGHNLETKDLNDLSKNFRNCSGELVRKFLNDYKPLLFRIFGAAPQSLEMVHAAVLASRGTEGDASYAQPLEKAADALLPETIGNTFDAVLRANTPRQRAAEMQGVLDAHEAHVAAKRDTLAAKIRERGTPVVPLQSSADVTETVSRLLRHAAGDHAAKSTPIYAVRAKTDAKWTPCKTIVEIQDTLGLDKNQVRGLMGQKALSAENAHLKDKYEIEDYDPQIHGMYDEALVAADVVAKAAPNVFSGSRAERAAAVLDSHAARQDAANVAACYKADGDEEAERCANHLRGMGCGGKCTDLHLFGRSGTNFGTETEGQCPGCGNALKKLRKNVFYCKSGDACPLSAAAARQMEAHGSRLRVWFVTGQGPDLSSSAVVKLYCDELATLKARLASEPDGTDLLAVSASTQGAGESKMDLSEPAPSAAALHGVAMDAEPVPPAAAFDGVATTTPASMGVSVAAEPPAPPPLGRFSRAVEQDALRDIEKKMHISPPRIGALERAAALPRRGDEENALAQFESDDEEERPSTAGTADTAPVAAKRELPESTPQRNKAKTTTKEAADGSRKAVFKKSPAK